MTEPVFFQPEGAWVGDVIPYRHDGDFLLYYLHEQRRDPKPGTPWHLVTTSDLVHYSDRGEALPSGGAAAPDLNAYTGSIVQDDEGTHHLFYTGQNPTRTAPDGRPLQLVMHAVSDDLTTWTKLPEDTFGAPEGYDPSDWRDPYVYRTFPDADWQLVLAARFDQGPERRRGVVARLTSPDLKTWTIAEPLWAPNRFITQECPEVFAIGEWWYLVYSEFTDAFVTRYRMARTPEGPWIAPKFDSLDGRAFYAAKSAERDGRRIFFGWIATREGSTDDGPWQWAGSMSTLEAVQAADGTLDFRIPSEVLDSFTSSETWTLPAAQLVAPTEYLGCVAPGELPEQFRLSLDITIEADTKQAGVLLHCDADGETGYALRLEPQAQRMVLDRWPRKATGTEQWQVSGDVPHWIDLERPAGLAPGSHHLDVVVDGQLLVANLDHRTCLSTRLYDHTGGHVGYFACDGTASVPHMTLSTRPTN